MKSFIFVILRVLVSTWQKEKVATKALRHKASLSL